MIKRYFGIDFGTTSSAVVEINKIDSELTIIRHGDKDDRPISSVVAINKENGEVEAVGREAKNNRNSLSEYCLYITSMKTKLEKKDKLININGKTWDIVDVVSEFFLHLRAQTKGDMKSAVVAVPVGFTPTKRGILRKAAELAGLNIMTFISEPTAAYIANMSELKGCSNVAVFDWGGGTLDVTIIHCADNKIEELASVGMELAGDDIDKELSDRIHAMIVRKKNIKRDLSQMSSGIKDSLYKKAEQLKIDLSEVDEADFSHNNYGDFGRVNLGITYEYFSEIVREKFIVKALDILDQAIKNANISFRNIDKLLMVGGSSRLASLEENIIDRYELTDDEADEMIYYPGEVMWNIGEGAAYAALTKGEYYSNQKISIRLSDGSLYTLLDIDDKIVGWKKSAVFGVVDDSEKINLVIVGSDDLRDNQIIDVPGYNFLSEKVILDAEITKDLIFRITVRSNHRTKDYSRIWEYSNLKFYYKL